MNFHEMYPLEDSAIDAVASILNRAKETLGAHQTLKELADTRENLTCQPKLLLTSMKTPVAVTAEALLVDTIEKKWRLTDTFMYVLNYKNCSRDDTSQYYYFEMVFRVEGHQVEHDVRHVAVVADWLLAVIKKKIKLAARIEGLRLF